MRRGEVEGDQWVVTGTERDGPQGKQRQDQEIDVSRAKDTGVPTRTGGSGQ